MIKRAAKSMGRGGARPGSGRKSKALTEKILEEKVAKKMSQAGIDCDNAEIKENQILSKKFITAKQHGTDEPFAALDIYLNTLKWLKEVKCDKLIPTELLEQYAVNSARWQQCEQFISDLGFMGRHPTTGGEIASPYVTLSIQYQKQANTAWYQIYQIVKEQSAESITSFVDEEDPMEGLLSRGKPKGS